MSTKTAIIKKRNGAYYIKGEKKRFLTKSAVLEGVRLSSDNYDYWKDGESATKLNWINRNK